MFVGGKSWEMCPLTDCNNLGCCSECDPQILETQVQGPVFRSNGAGGYFKTNICHDKRDMQIAFPLMLPPMSEREGRPSPRTTEKDTYALDVHRSYGIALESP